MDATYNLNGGFKPTLKRFADLQGPDYFPTSDAESEEALQYIISTGGASLYAQINHLIEKLQKEGKDIRKLQSSIDKEKLTHAQIAEIRKQLKKLRDT